MHYEPFDHSPGDFPTLNLEIQGKMRSMLIFRAGCQMTLFSEPNFKGENRTFSATHANQCIEDLGDFDAKAMSAKTMYNVTVMAGIPTPAPSPQPTLVPTPLHTPEPTPPPTVLLG